MRVRRAPRHTGACRAHADLSGICRRLAAGGEAQLEQAGSTIDEMWASLCSQTILGTPEVENLDARIIRHTEIARLESEVDKLTRDHQRVKNPAQRNEIYAKLHKAKAQLAKLREA